LILQPTYRLERDRAVVQLFGRLDDGPPFLIEDDRFRPYLYVGARDVGRLVREPGISIEAQGLRDLAGQPVARVVVPFPRDVAALRDRLAQAGVATHEADIRFAYRYLIDRGLRAGVAIEGEAGSRPGAPGLLVYRNPSLTPVASRPALRILSLDLETSPDG